MKSPIKIVLSMVLVAMFGCSEKAAQAEKARQDADAKARAQAAKKEMETLPKVFSTPDYLKKNEPAKANTATQTKTESLKK